jgi:hypothetical protein
MPLTKKGETIMAAMKKQYGEEEGERIFYKAKNAGTIEGVDALIRDHWSKEAREAAIEAREHGLSKEEAHELREAIEEEIEALSERMHVGKHMRRRLAKAALAAFAAQQRYVSKHGGEAAQHKSWAIAHQAAQRHTGQYGAHADARARVVTGYDPMGRQAVTYITDPDGTVRAYDPFGREIMLFEEEDSMRPFFSMLPDQMFSIVGDAKKPPTQVQLYDNIEIDDAAKVTFTTDGFMKAMPRIARTGIQVYSGDECGITFKDQVRVYRPPSAVFDAKAIHSLTHLPTTLEHPSSAVTPANWKDHATGETGDEVLRDGSTIRVPLMLRDAKAIAAFKDGSKKQLSVGYTCDLIWQDGVVPAGEHHAGEAYDAIQSNIRANHLAQCAAARGGPILTIGDTRKETDMNLKTVMVDGIACEMTDTAAQLVQKTIGTLQATIDEFKKKEKETEKECDDALKEIVQLKTVVATKDAEIVTLKKSVDDAKLTPAQIDALVTTRQKAIDKARAFLGDSTKFDGKTIEDVRRMVVDKHLGEVAKNWTDAQVEVSFDTIAAGLKTNGGGGGVRTGSIDHAVSVFAGRPGPGYQDVNPQAIRDAAYFESVREMNDAWKSPAQREADAAARKAAGY